MRRMHLTLRARLTLVYGALFLVAGLVMMGLTWALVQQQLLNGGASVMIQAVDPTYETGDSDSPPPADDFALQVGEVVDEANADALRALLTQGAVAVVLVGGLAVWIGWLVAGRMLQPLATITATARRIADAPDVDRGMHERIGLTGPRDEITDLADTFDGMLARLDTSFDAQRRFIANASHELRTPLTLNRALLEVAASRPHASDDVRLLSDTLLEINVRHERLINGLLLLARSERELSERRFVDLADVVEHVSETAETEGVELRLSLDEAPTMGDPVLLEQLVRNLIENGVRHNIAEGGWLRVATRTTSAGTALLEVSNSGPVVAPYEIDTLFEPFRRVVGERTADARGVGLGLSIVQAIVRAHDGTVSLTPRMEGGLTVTVELPAEKY